VTVFTMYVFATNSIVASGMTGVVEMQYW